jgi:hypothetical protein
MKRLAWLLLIAILAFSTVAFDLPAPPPALSAGQNRTCHNVRLMRICTWVSEGVVRPGSSVTIYGSLSRKGEAVSGQLMRVIWSSKTTQTCLGITDATGVASCTTYVPRNLSTGRSVNVKVWMDKYKITTQFRIKVGDRDRESDD